MFLEATNEDVQYEPHEVHTLLSHALNKMSCDEYELLRALCLMLHDVASHSAEVRISAHNWLTHLFSESDGFEQLGCRVGAQHSMEGGSSSHEGSAKLFQSQSPVRQMSRDVDQSNFSFISGMLDTLNWSRQFFFCCS